METCLLIGIQKLQHAGGSDQGPSIVLPHQMLPVIKREPTGKSSICCNSESGLASQCLVYSHMSLFYEKLMVLQMYI